MKTTKCLAYQRVSTVKQENERQQTAIEKYCNDNNIFIANTLEEKESGLIRNRSAYSSIPQYFKDNLEVKHLVIDEISRLGRTYEVLPMVELLNSMGVCTHIINNNLKTLDNKGIEDVTVMQMLGMFAAQSKSEATLIKRRMQAGKLLGASKGNNVTSNPPFGYTLDNKKLIIDENESEIVKQIFEKYIQGEKVSNIAQWLNDNHILTKKQQHNITINYKTHSINKFFWSASTVNKLLTNPVYIGERHYKNQVFYFDYLQIIDKTTFEAVQQKKQSYKKQPKESNKKHTWLLDTGVLKCMVCGEIALKQNFNNSKDYRYFCKSKSLKYRKIVETDCGNGSLSIIDFESQLMAVISNDKTLLSLLNKASKGETNYKQQIEDLQAQLKTLDSELSKCDNNEKRLVKYALNSNISDKILKSSIDEINTEREKINSKIERINNEILSLINIENKTQLMIVNDIQNKEIYEFDNSDKIALNAYLMSFVDSVSYQSTDTKQVFIFEIRTKTNYVLKYRFDFTDYKYKILDEKQS